MPVNELSPNTKTTFIPIELTSNASIRSAASQVLALNTKIDVLIANAGVMALADFTLSKDNIETQFAINHLSHFLLINILLPTLSPNARIINMSSEGHALGNLGLPSSQPSTWTSESVRHSINFDSGKDYTPFAGYGQSKGAQVLYTLALFKRLFSSSTYKNKNITVNAVHPGMIFGTGLGTHLAASDIEAIGPAFTSVNRPPPGAKNLEEGLSTCLVAVLDDRLQGVSGKYMLDCGIGEQAEWCKDEELAELLWKASEILVDEEFKI
jgi:retinol dehydrogenase-12